MTSKPKAALDFDWQAINIFVQTYKDNPSLIALTRSTVYDGIPQLAHLARSQDICNCGRIGALMSPRCGIRTLQGNASQEQTASVGEVVPCDAPTRQAIFPWRTMGNNTSAPLPHERHALSWNVSKHDSQDACVVHWRCRGIRPIFAAFENKRLVSSIDHRLVFPHSNIRLNCLVQASNPAELSACL